MKKTYFNYPVPHLIGRIDYSGQQKFDPDGDTVHLRDPLLLVNGKSRESTEWPVHGMDAWKSEAKVHSGQRQFLSVRSYSI